MSASTEVFAVGMNSFNQVCPPMPRSERNERVRGRSPSHAQLRAVSTPVPVPLEVSEEEGEVVQVSAGERMSYALTAAGTVYEWGYNHGQHVPHPRAKTMGLPLQVRRLAAGAKHCLAILEGGYVASWGCGYFGQLGHREEVSCHEPRIIDRLKPDTLGDRVTLIAAGAYHSAAVTSQGRLVMWGLNRDGQCAQGHKENTAPPEFARLNDAVREISLGRNHTACICVEGHTRQDRVYCWGATGFGRLGVHTSAKYTATPKLVTYFRHDSVHSVKCGANHTLALTRDGTVHAWGYGAEGQCGQGNALHLRTPRVVEELRRQGVRAISISAGNWWSACISVDGDIYTWGYGDGGWLGCRPPDPDATPYVEPSPPTPTSNGAAHPEPVGDSISFDSRHNALLPVRVERLAGDDRHPKELGCGGGHMLILASDEKPAVEWLLGSFGAQWKPSAAAKGEDDPDTPPGMFPPMNAKSATAQHAPMPPRHAHAGDAHQAMCSVAQEPHLTEEEAHAAGDFAGLPPEVWKVFSAVRHGRVEEVESALGTSGFDVDTKDEKGNTLLHYAAQNGRKTMCRVILKYGADVNGRNRKGNTPLHYCFAYGFSDLASWLIGKGADDSILNAEELSPYDGMSGRS